MAGYFALQWHITNRCDQRCKHCYIFNSGKPIPHEEWTLENAEKLLDNFKSFCEKTKKRPTLAITGGDPILHPQFWQILELVRKQNIPFNILGNPFHLTPEVIKQLKRMGCSRYQLSVDGLKGTHDAMRMTGSFDVTIEKLKLLKACGLSPVVMTTVSNVNYKEVPAITRLLVDIGVEVAAFARYCPTHGDTNANIPPEEYHNFLNEMWDIYEKLANKGTTFTLKDHLWQAILYEKGLLALEDDDVVYEGCHCGISHMTLLETGEVYACRRMETPIGKFPQQSLEECFFGPKMECFRDFSKIEGCKNCKLLNYCRGCRAVAFGTSGGNVFAKDPQCWLCSND